MAMLIGKITINHGKLTHFGVEVRDLGVPCEILVVCIGRKPCAGYGRNGAWHLVPRLRMVRACGARAELIFLEMVKRHQHI